MSKHSNNSPKSLWLNRTLWLLMTLAATGITIFNAAPYLTFNPAFNRIPLNESIPWHFLSIAIHAVPGGLALLLGPFQFVPALRRRSPRTHRIVGKIYLICIFIGSIVGVAAATASTSGLAAQVGFLLLAAAWFYSGLLAYQTARRRQFELHRIWMIRNYSLTFAAVLLRVFLGVGLLFMERNPALTFGDIYTSSVWGSILVSYLAAEWFIVQPALRPAVQKPVSQPH